MKIIGLTGPSGSGKSELCSILSGRGIPSVNADEVYHSLLIPPSACLNALCERFGSGILKEDGTLDRPALAKIVFAPGAESSLEALNCITHKFVVEKISEILAELAEKGVAAAVIDAPALFEAGIDKDCDLVVSLLADKGLRAERIIKRDGISYDAAIARINAQKTDNFYTERSDVVIYNGGDISELERQSEKIIEFAEGKKA